MSDIIRLYSYYRSSAAWRVRLALAIKNLNFECIEINLINEGGEQHSSAYLDKNPQALVPTLKIGQFTLTQSIAIIEYLDECFPQQKLIDGSPEEKAEIRRLAHIIAMDIHPLNNLRVQQYLIDTLDCDSDNKHKWVAHWIEKGFSTVEHYLASSSGKYCIGNSLSLADCCLIPQVYNARRFDIPLEPFPTICKVDANCASLDAFSAAHPNAYA